MWRWIGWLATSSLCCLIAAVSVLGAETKEGTDPPSARTGQPPPGAEDLQLLQEAGLKTDGKSLLSFLRKRIPRPDDIPRIKTFIGQLGSEDFLLRQQAYEGLLELGAAARTQLLVASRSGDVEVRVRARRALRAIKKRAGPSVVAAANRVLAHHLQKNTEAGWVQQAPATLMQFLPHAQDEQVIEALQDALAATVGDEVPQELLKGLEASTPLHRRVVGTALTQAKQTDLARKLLGDPNLKVRIGVARALILEVGDKNAVPVLIALLTRVPREDRWLIEDTLYQIAGDKAPKESVANLSRFQQAWVAWWKKEGPTLDLKRAAQRNPILGYTIIAMRNSSGSYGKVIEIDRKRKVRWELTNLKGVNFRYPVDAQLLGKDRILLAEYYGRRVICMDRKGKKAHWIKTLTTYPQSVQPLRNGNIFIATRNALLEVNDKGKQIWRLARTDGVAAAYRCRNGEIVYVNTKGECVRLDAKRRKVKSFRVGTLYYKGSRIQVLANGHILVPQYSYSRVAEFDKDGRMVWSARSTYPTSVQRLRNGNTLVTSYSQRRVYEIDRTGKEVWSYSVIGRPFKGRRR